MEQSGRSQAVLEAAKVTQRALVLMHPFEDKCSPEEIRREIADKLMPRGWACDVVEVGSAAELDAAAKRGREENYDLVAVAGGDGTIARVARHLVGTNTPLGIIPAGKDNYLAMDLGLPEDSGQAAALLAADHKVGHLDALRVEGRYFFLQVGTAASLGEGDTTELRSASEVAAAANESTQGPIGFRSRRFSLQIDGRHYRLGAWQVIVINTGGLRSEAFRSGFPNDPSDHAAELVALRVRSAWDLLKSVFTASPARRDVGISITYHRIRDDVLVVPDQPMPVEGDGEPIGTTPVRVTLVPAAVKVIVPRTPVSRAERAAQAPRRRHHVGAGWFRTALLRRLGPLGVLDTALFLAVSRLPHPRSVNLAMRTIEVGMASGRGWIAWVFGVNFPHWRKLWREELGIAPLIWLTSAVTEYPIKAIFARPRPFVDLMLTSVVGRKPSSHSFPSGHSSAAFAGAWLLSRRHPRWSPAFYAFASLVAFSRVYQGVHYPSDVAIGAVTGTALASTFRWTLGRFLGRLTERP